MQGEYIFDDCCYYICTSFGSFTKRSCYLRVQEFNSTHSRMRSLIAKHIVQRLSSKRVRQIEIRNRVHHFRSNNPRPSPDYSPRLRDRISEWPGDEARHSTYIIACMLAIRACWIAIPTKVKTFLPYMERLVRVLCTRSRTHCTIFINTHR